ncbi:ADP-ribosylglycohydrolase family protein [Aeromicrobium sp. CTD01-1L150]|uniref:ADP-ribosylglycohydrolase family protein n=1 Tax=Aeromicrobium sp. CTD01-1L150 TaxID=3341830 RepID=UPI0035BF1DD8
MTTDLQSKFHGSLAAGCIADALGAPTEELSRRQIQKAFGGYVTDFHAPLPEAPYAKGRKAAQITDDSSQMLMLAQLLASRGNALSAADMADLLVRWSANPNYFPHFAGPTTRAAIERLARGDDPLKVGRSGSIMTQGSSNGAAMRVAPIGLFHHADPRGLLEAAYTSCVPSHNTTAGVAGATAIAAAVARACSPGVELTDIVKSAVEAADEGARIGCERGRDVPGASVPRRIERAAQLAVAARDDTHAIELISDEIGVGLPAAEAVPAAIGFFVAGAGDPIRVAQLAANAGGDSDTIGCMGAAVAGAYRGIEAIPTEVIGEVETANDLDLADVAAQLLSAARQ